MRTTTGGALGLEPARRHPRGRCDIILLVPRRSLTVIACALSVIAAACSSSDQEDASNGAGAGGADGGGRGGTSASGAPGDAGESSTGGPGGTGAGAAGGSGLTGGAGASGTSGSGATAGQPATGGTGATAGQGATGGSGATAGQPGTGGTGATPGVTGECASVRLTEYWEADTGWCEFNRTSSVLPDFVQAGMTFAIAEPYNGSSYEGEPGEACGECWEIDSIASTEIVMVHDLCPIEGNPVCAGGHFHFDLSPTAADALQGGGLDAAQARRVPCPVTGNVHLEILDRNEWGYLRFAFINHRFPIRTAEYRVADGADWLPAERSGAAWHVVDDNDTFADGSPGGVFRITSATGETVEGSGVLTLDYDIGSIFDTGAQFAEATAEGPACEFIPPGDVYDEGWGGIDEVRWSPNPWGDASASETTEGCADGSASCVLISTLAQWDGFHLYYRQAFPTTTFSQLSLQLRAQSGGGELLVAASNDGVECDSTSVEVGSDWVTVEIDLAATCGALTDLNAVTVSNAGDTMDLLVDEVFFE